MSFWGTQFNHNRWQMFPLKGKLGAVESSPRVRLCENWRWSGAPAARRVGVSC